MEEANFTCPICGNKDMRYVGYKNGHAYCRKCISFRGKEALNEYEASLEAPLILSYQLSDEQKKISDALVKNYHDGINSLVQAVCGSGKTEIVLSSIQHALESGLKVGYAVPRRDVVIELYQRFKSIFPLNYVEYVCGGHCEHIEADLICVTTHQLFRYSNYFDLLILDEIDAFPFNGSDVLYALFKRSLRGHYIMLSATPTKEVIEMFSKPDMEILRLDARFHHHPLPVPQIIVRKSFFKLFFLRRILARFLRENKPVFVFYPTIALCETIYKFLSPFFPNMQYVHSKRNNRTEIINDFRQGKYKILFTTAILERGVTLENLQVVIYQSNHSLFTTGALIQISGRVGRKMSAPDGEVIFLADETTKEMDEAIQEIKRANSSLQAMLSSDKQ